MSRLKNKTFQASMTEQAKTNNLLPKKRRWKELKRTKKAQYIFLFILVGSLTFNGIIRLFSYRNVLGEARWIETNGQKYLFVSANTPYELGYLTGQKLWSQIISLKFILMLMCSEFHLSYFQLEQRAKQYLSYIPIEQKDEMRGLADGSTNSFGFPITFTDILIQNTFLDIFYGQIIPENPNLVLGCTAIVSKNDGGSIMYGQNFDFINLFSSTISFVLHKLGSHPSVFGIRFGATLNIPMGKNEHNVTSLVTVVRSTIHSVLTIPTSCRARLAFESSTSADEFLNNLIIQYGFIQPAGMVVNIIDQNKFYKIEVVPNDFFIDEPNYSIATNTFLNSSWQEFLQDPLYSKDRQTEAESIFSDKYEDFCLTYEELIEILKDEPYICQRNGGMTDVGTIAFFTINGFGLGNLQSDNVGLLPI